MKSRIFAVSSLNARFFHLTSLLVLGLIFLSIMIPDTARGQSADKTADLSVSPASIDFFNAPINTPVTQGVTVTNSGSSDGYLDIFLGTGGGCDPLSLPGVSGQVTVPAYGSVEVLVEFVSAVDQDYACHLNLGGGLDDIPISASIWTPFLEFTVDPEALIYGFTPLTVPSTLEVTISNIGGLPFLVSPSIVAACSDFTITSGGEPEELIAYNSKTIEVTFTPSALGGQVCHLDLGETVPPVELNGIGVEPVTSWVVWPDTLDFGYVATDSTAANYLTIENTGDLPIPISPSVDSSCLVFTPLFGDQVVQPGEIKAVHVEFQPQVETTYHCDLALGDILPDVPLTGVGLPYGMRWDAPAMVDFGTTGVGKPVRRYFAIRNTGTVAIDLDVSLPDTCQSFQLVSGAGAYTLVPGATRTYVVDCHPVVEGTHTVWLDLGLIVPDLKLIGEAYARAEQVIVTPNPLGFGWIFLGGELVETVTVNNAGGTFVDLDIGLAETDQGFTNLGLNGPLTLAPGYSHEVQIRFLPQAAGTFQTTLNLGASATAVVVSGSAELEENVCTVTPDSLVFGPLEVGDTQIMGVTITNNSHQNQTVYPRPVSGVFSVLQNSITVVGGGSATVNVRFSPNEHGSFYGTLDLNNQYCQDVALVGHSTLSVIPGQNQVGIFFDTDFTTNQTHTFQANEIVQGYLVMLEPSDSSGVSAWELRTDLVGDATWLSWQLEGQALNFGSYQEFIVGIGGDPLPYGPSILLATFNLLVALPYPEPVLIELHPIRQPSLPDAMVWAPGRDSSLLTEMVATTSTPMVAGINVSNPSDVGIPVVPASTRLLPNVPNPFNPQTEIRFELARAQQARVALYDVKGRLMKVLVDGSLAAGPHTRVWQGRDSAGRQVPSGVYYVRMVTPDRTDHRKIMLLK